MPHAYKTRNACKRGMARAGAVIQDDIPETVTVEESIEQVVGAYAGMFTFSEPVELSDPMIAKRFCIVVIQPDADAADTTTKVEVGEQVAKPSKPARRHARTPTRAAAAPASASDGEPAAKKAKRDPNAPPVFNVDAKGEGRNITGGSKCALVGGLLRRKGGCTWRDICDVLVKANGEPWSRSAQTSFMRHDMPVYAAVGVRTIEHENGNHRYVAV